MEKVFHCLLFLGLCIAASHEKTSLVRTTTIKAGSASELVSNQTAKFNETSTATPIQLDPAQQGIVNDMSWPVKIMLYKEHLSLKGNELKMEPWTDAAILRRGRDDFEDSSGSSYDMRSKDDMDMKSDETQIKLRLFTLMDETARDCDLKVRRAELIRDHYKNNTAFDAGYLMGSISDKFRHMTDTTNTLKRMYDQWKPIEHINAYEQIANQAIEISHLIDTGRKEIEKLDSLNGYSTISPPSDTAASRLRKRPRNLYY